MITLTCRWVAYKTNDSMSKVNVTHRGQRSEISILCLVQAINYQTIVISSYKVVEMFTLMCRRITYKTNDYFKGLGYNKMLNFVNLYFIPCMNHNFTSYCYISVTNVHPGL